MSNTNKELATTDPQISLKWLEELENKDKETVTEQSLENMSDGDHKVAEENQESSMILTIEENIIVVPFDHDDFPNKIIEMDGVNDNYSNDSHDEYNPENDSSDDDCSSSNFNSENNSIHSEIDCDSADSNDGLASSCIVQGS